MKIVYLVTRIGTYHQGIFGVFDYYIEAKEHAISILKNYEPDNYHDYFIEPIILNFNYNKPCNYTFNQSRDVNYRLGNRSNFTNKKPKKYYYGWDEEK